MKKLNQSVISVALLSFLLVGMAFLLSGCGIISQDPEAKISVTSHSVSNGTVSVNKGETINFDGTNSEPNGGEIIDYDWDFKSNKSDTVTSTQEKPSYTYNSTGTYTVTLTVTDDNSNSNTTSIEVEVGEEPLEASFTIDPDPATVGTEVTFDASDSTGNIASYGWDIDYSKNPGVDIQTTSETVTHTYRQTGSYKIGLTVTDTDGDISIAGKSLEVQTS